MCLQLSWLSAFVVTEQLYELSPVWFISFFFKPLDVEDLSHCKQLNVLLPLWFLSCFFMPLDVEDLLHWKQLNDYYHCGFFHVSLNPQMLLTYSISQQQLNNLSPVWVLSCVVVCICSHRWSSWMVCHNFEFFHVSSYHSMLSICCNTAKSCLSPVCVLYCCFKLLNLEDL